MGSKLAPLPSCNSNVNQYTTISYNKYLEKSRQNEGSGFRIPGGGQKGDAVRKAGQMKIARRLLLGLRAAQLGFEPLFRVSKIRIEMLSSLKFSVRQFLLMVPFISDAKQPVSD